MIEATRRLFLFGTAAAVTAASLPKITVAEPTEIVLAPSVIGYERRRILDMEFGALDLDPQDGIITLRLTTQSGRAVFAQAINRRSSYFWRSYRGPDEDTSILLTSADTMALSVDGQSGTRVRVELCCEDYYGDDSEPILVSEIHEFNIGQPSAPPKLYALDVRNSIRLKAHKRAA